MARIALFGGSFNPPHIAHQLGCLLVLETTACDALWMVPAFEHPFEKTLAPFHHRFEMCLLAAHRLEGVEVSRIEADLGGPSRTLETVRHLRALRPDDSFSLVVGADVWQERHLWYGWAELETLVELVVLGRRGYAGPPALLPEVSSSTVRARIAEEGDAQPLLSTEVMRYIRDHHLYGWRARP